MERDIYTTLQESYLNLYNPRVEQIEESYHEEFQEYLNENYEELYTHFVNNILNEIKAVNQGNVQRTAPKDALRPVRNAAGFHGKVYGLGKDKRYQNQPKKDDARIKNYNDAKGVNVKPKRDAKDRMGPAPSKPKRNKTSLNRDATRELRRMGWKGKDDDKA